MPDLDIIETATGLRGLKRRREEPQNKESREAAKNAKKKQLPF